MSLDLLVALLREPLSDGTRPPDLGARLRDAADQLCRARLPPERIGPVRAWRQALGGFERLTSHEQKIQLATGLRANLDRADRLEQVHVQERVGHSLGAQRA